MARIIALSAFQQLGYTRIQAEQLEAAAVLLAAATGLTLDQAETDIRDLAESLGPKPIRYGSPVLSGKNW